MSEALGMIETKGYVAAWKPATQWSRAANVTLIKTVAIGAD